MYKKKEKNMEQSLCHHGVSHSNPLPVSNNTQPIRTKCKSSLNRQLASESFLTKKEIIKEIINVK